MKAAGYTDFTMPKHSWAWRYYGVRPGKESQTPSKCKSEYCIYDALHGDYVYSGKWLELLIREWAKPGVRAKIIAHHSARRGAK